MSDGDWRSLAAAVTSGQTPPGADPALVAFLSNRADLGAPGAQILEALRARNTADNALEARIAHVLARLQRLGHIVARAVGSTARASRRRWLCRITVAAVSFGSEASAPPRYGAGAEPEPSCQSARPGVSAHEQVGHADGGAEREGDESDVRDRTGGARDVEIRGTSKGGNVRSRTQRRQSPPFIATRKDGILASRLSLSPMAAARASPNSYGAFAIVGASTIGSTCSRASTRRPSAASTRATSSAVVGR